MASITKLLNNFPDASLPNTIVKRESAYKPSPGRDKTEAQLSLDFQPSEYSVLCSRGKESVNHIGNRRFRKLASTYVQNYSQADSKAAKSVIVSDIITSIRQVGGNFCKYKRGAWFELGEHYAREKVTALLRDLLHTQYRSSNKSKIAVRKARKRSLKQQSEQTLVNGTEDSDDSSQSSSCWGSSKDYLGREHSPGYDFFDIDVF
jgi:hypothetical protein